jgi:hypothetical protein
MTRPPGTNGQKPPTEAGFFSISLGDSGIWEDQDEDGETKNIFNFNKTGFKA